MTVFDGTTLFPARRKCDSMEDRYVLAELHLCSAQMAANPIQASVVL